jgi:hypothetical protein
MKLRCAATCDCRILVNRPTRAPASTPLAAEVYKTTRAAVHHRQSGVRVVREILKEPIML